MKDGIAQGYIVDICNSIASNLEKHRKMKLYARYVPVSANNRSNLLQSGAIDKECGATTSTKAREKEVAFSYPIFVTGTRLAVCTQSPITDFSHLGSTRLVVVTGSSCARLISSMAAEAKANGKAISISSLKDNNEAIQAVAANQADAFCTDDVLLAGAIASNNLTEKLQRVGKPLSIAPYAIMLGKNDTDFSNLIDTVLADTLRSGAASKLGKKWFDTPELRYKLNSMTLSASQLPVKSFATLE